MAFAEAAAVHVKADTPNTASLNPKPWRARAESLSTAKFAQRAKAVRNAARVNEDLDQRTLLRRYEGELRRLRAELQQRQRDVVDKRQLLQARACHIMLYILHGDWSIDQTQAPVPARRANAPQRNILMKPADAGMRLLPSKTTK